MKLALTYIVVTLKFKLVSTHFVGLVSQHIVSQLEVECLESYCEGDGVAPFEVLLRVCTILPRVCLRVNHYTNAPLELYTSYTQAVDKILLGVYSYAQVNSYIRVTSVDK